MPFNKDEIGQCLRDIEGHEILLAERRIKVQALIDFYINNKFDAATDLHKREEIRDLHKAIKRTENTIELLKKRYEKLQTPKQ